MEAKSSRISVVVAVFMITLALALDGLKILADFIYCGFIFTILGYLIFFPWLWFTARFNPLNKKNAVSTSVGALLSLIPWIPPITFFVVRAYLITQAEDRGIMPGEKDKSATNEGDKADAEAEEGDKNTNKKGGQAVPGEETPDSKQAGSGETAGQSEARDELIAAGSPRVDGINAKSGMPDQAARNSENPRTEAEEGQTPQTADKVEEESGGLTPASNTAKDDKTAQTNTAKETTSESKETPKNRDQADSDEESGMEEGPDRGNDQDENSDTEELDTGEGADIEESDTENDAEPLGNDNDLGDTVFNKHSPLKTPISAKSNNKVGQNRNNVIAIGQHTPKPTEKATISDPYREELTG